MGDDSVKLKAGLSAYQEPPPPEPPPDEPSPESSEDGDEDMTDEAEFMVRSMKALNDAVSNGSDP